MGGSFILKAIGSFWKFPNASSRDNGILPKITQMAMPENRWRESTCFVLLEKVCVCVSANSKYQEPLYSTSVWNINESSSQIVCNLMKELPSKEIGSGTSNILVEMLKVIFEVCSLSMQVGIWASSLAAIAYIFFWIFLNSSTTEIIVAHRILLIIHLVLLYVSWSFSKVKKLFANDKQNVQNFLLILYFYSNCRMTKPLVFLLPIAIYIIVNLILSW